MNVHNHAQFSQIVPSLSKRLPCQLLLNYELTGSFPMQISSVHNSKGKLLVKIFLDQFNRESDTFAVCNVSQKVFVSQELLQ